MQTRAQAQKKKKSQKATKGISNEAKYCALETVTGGVSSNPKKRKACRERVKLRGNLARCKRQLQDDPV